MTYTLVIATDADRAIVVESLHAAADQRVRVAKRAARTVAQDKATGRDVRARSVKVATLLAEADVLTELARTLTDAPALAVMTPEAMLGLPEPTAPDDVDPADDGTSAAAQAIAEAAGLDAAVIIEDDVDTGATAEDDEADPVEVLA